MISPPYLHEHSDAEADTDWVNRMMPVNPQRNFPMNAGQSWHGGIDYSIKTKRGQTEAYHMWPGHGGGK
ncbi:hypothetical protein OH773_19725 [Buttiauxella sp. WJP83]|uniref:hypothetical protein n=1 Tax=Buttiauxella sp. WJP83 TaxID=2986951 RepID=UPI0022DD1F22|nr:hypothetical protein [Buttiauxella sp. WJP83]WBM70339.1 hypothetical protein OH773_19725 [Buttiauxella sp. WJP83]